MTSQVPNQVGQELTAANVRHALQLSAEYDDFLDGLQHAAATPAAPVPASDELAGLLARMGTPARDVDEIVAARPDAERDPELCWMISCARNQLVARLGSYDRMPTWPRLPDRLGAAARYFYVYVFAAATPDVLRFHRAHGVPEEVSWATFADLGDKIGLDRRTHGSGGLRTQAWFKLHFRGVLYSLGRLQFNLLRLPDIPGRPDVDGAGPGARAVGLGVHIPETGPLAPAACDASFARARPFFERTFPALRPRIAICHSWLLDPQLADYLPAGSNVVRFGRRFTLLPTDDAPGDATVLEFVFRRIDPCLDTLPQDTTLQCAIVSHLRAGKHWHARSGWLELP